MEPIKPPNGGEYDPGETVGDPPSEPEQGHLTPAGRSFMVAASIIVVVIVVVVIAVLTNLNTTNETHDEAEETQTLARRIEDVGNRIADCTTVGGRCYEENLKRSGEAITAILQGLQGQITPHRLRNEGENLCQIYVFGGTPPARVADRPLEEVVAYYQQCVLERSGGTEPPALPENPYNTSTTTTTTVGRR